MDISVSDSLIYHPPTFLKEPNISWPAWVCFVQKDGSVNIAGFDHNGEPFKDTYVTIVEDGNELTEELKRRGYAEWIK